MSQVEETLSREERFSRSNNRLALGSAATFGLWQLSDLLVRTSSSGARAALVTLSVAASLGWIVLLSLTMRNVRVIQRDSALRAALHDERAQGVRLKAYRVGFVAMLASAAVLGIPPLAQVIPAVAVSRLIVVIGVSAFLVSAVVFDRE